MAGIGFVLRKLSSQKNLSGVFQAFIYSTFISSGPWLFSIIALSIILAFGRKILPFHGIKTFQIIIIYNFSFSYFFYGIFSLIITRYISDSIYKKKLANIMGMMFGSLILLYIVVIPFEYFLYFSNNFETDIAISASINFTILLGVWHITTFLSTLRNYKSISFSFFAGMAFAVFASFYLGHRYSTLGLINGFTLGLCIILAVLFAFVFNEYPFKIQNIFIFLKYFKNYWQLAISGTLYSLAIWVDKWLMWYSPDSTIGACGLRYDINYSSAVFFGYLTIIPGLGYFMFAIETSFYEKILEFYNSINNKANFNEIEISHKNLIKCLFRNLLDFMILQGTITVIVVLMAHKILILVGIPMVQLSIFRYSVLSAFYMLFANYFVIVLYYFDSITYAMYINAVFFISNVIFTLFSISIGFEYYGMGLFISCMLTFIVAGILTIKYLYELPYHTFITRNAHLTH
jgi:polysaccharide biosynthesis protein PelG